MNRTANLHDIKDFRKMCSYGDACPLKSLEFRNNTGNRIIHKPFLDHVIDLCNKNDTNILDLLTGINDDIHVSMAILGNNNPLFKRKVNSVIDEWNHDITYDELFHKPPRNAFNYNDILSCNQDVINLDKDMNELEKYVSNNDGSLYRRVKDLQSNGVSCHQKINKCIRNLDYINDVYEPKYPNILLDLSTRQKPFYVDQSDLEGSDLVELSNRSSYEDIPNNVSNIISNSIHIPNMISKETQYMKNILGKLKNNVTNKEKTLQDVINNTPERKQCEKSSPFTNFIYGLMNNEDTLQMNSDEDTLQMDSEENEYPNTVAPNKTSQSSRRSIRDKLSSVSHDLNSNEENKIISTKTPIRPRTDSRQEKKTFKIEPNYVPKDYQESADLDEELAKDTLERNILDKESDELEDDELEDEQEDDELEDEQEDDDDGLDDDKLDDDELDDDKLDDDKLDDDELDDDKLDDDGLDDDGLDDDGLDDDELDDDEQDDDEQDDDEQDDGDRLDGNGLDFKNTGDKALSGGYRGYRLNFF